MTEPRVRALLRALAGAQNTEMYFHPAARPDVLLDRLMPGYEHAAELQALLAVTPPEANC